MKAKNIIMKKNLYLYWVILALIVLIALIIYWPDIARGFQDGYNSVPK